MRSYLLSVRGALQIAALLSLANNMYGDLPPDIVGVLDRPLVRFLAEPITQALEQLPHTVLRFFQSLTRQTTTL